MCNYKIGNSLEMTQYIPIASPSFPRLQRCRQCHARCLSARWGWKSTSHQFPTTCGCSGCRLSFTKSHPGKLQVSQHGCWNARKMDDGSLVHEDLKGSIWWKPPWREAFCTNPGTLQSFQPPFVSHGKNRRLTAAPFFNPVQHCNFWSRNTLSVDAVYIV